jgi:hypothetical protein
MLRVGKQPLVGRSIGSPTLKEAARETIDSLASQRVRKLEQTCIYSPYIAVISAHNCFVRHFSANKQILLYIVLATDLLTSTYFSSVSLVCRGRNVIR